MIYTKNRVLLYYVQLYTVLTTFGRGAMVASQLWQKMWVGRSNPLLPHSLYRFDPSMSLLTLADFAGICATKLPCLFCGLFSRSRSLSLVLHMVFSVSYFLLSPNASAREYASILHSLRRSYFRVPVPIYNPLSFSVLFLQRHSFPRFAFAHIFRLGVFHSQFSIFPPNSITD